MGKDPASSRPRGSRRAAQAACEVIEVLEVLWERGRDTASTPVSASQLRVLRSLDRENGMSLRTLGERMGAAPSSVSRLCDRLEVLGLVERSTSTVRRRELRIHLTGKGTSCLRELRAQQRQGLKAALAIMPSADRDDLLEGIQGLAEAFDEAGTDGYHEPPGATPSLRST